MQSKPLEFPLAVARDFVRDLMAFHAEENTIKPDETAPHTLGMTAGKTIPELAEEYGCGVGTIWRALQPETREAA
jgi:hypothetical protein